MEDPERRLEAFCRDEHPRLVRWLSLHVGNQAVAEELAQDAFARLCQHWSRVQRMDNPRAWLNRVAVNLASSWFRRRSAERRARARHGPSDHIDAGPDSAVVVATRQAIAALPVRQRAALLLRHFADLPVAEVARTMGCAEGTVKALTHQATSRLRDQLVDHSSEVHP